MPKNILMIGPTGVGKTEISRRLARLAGAPFIKVEATKFTEVGYVGRDVEQIVRDLVEIAIALTREQASARTCRRAPTRRPRTAWSTRWSAPNASAVDQGNVPQEAARRRARRQGDRDRGAGLRRRHAAVRDSRHAGRADGRDLDRRHLRQARRGAPRRGASRSKESYEILVNEESDKLLDQDQLVQEAIHAVENNGIVFLDEIDKITARDGRMGADVSREGVQRDLLPLIEGTTVSTKHGAVKTDHILFIASGAFHVAKPSDLLPELQGRLPIRVELKALTREDLRRILTEPEASLIKQYVALMATEGVNARVHRGRDRRHRRRRGAGQLDGREYRRAAPADRDGARARRHLVRRDRPLRRDGARSTATMCAAGWRSGQERGSEPVYFVDHRSSTTYRRHCPATSEVNPVHSKAAAFK